MENKSGIVVIEIGAGSNIPTIRNLTESIADESPFVNAIRINPTEPEIKTPHIAIEEKGLETLERIDAILEEGKDL